MSSSMQRDAIGGVLIVEKLSDWTMGRGHSGIFDGSQLSSR